MENFILCDPQGLQTGIDLALKPGEMVIYNWVDGKRVVLARKMDGGDWKLENDVYPAYVTEVNSTFNQVDGHRSTVRCVFETNTVFNLHELPIVNVSTVARTPDTETVELGFLVNVSDDHYRVIGKHIEDIARFSDHGKWKITATRVG